MWVEYSYIKIHTSIQSNPQKPFAAMSSLAPSSVIAETPVKVSPVMDCKVGSMQTLSQISDSQLPYRVMDLIVPDGREAPFRTRECMFRGEVSHTSTVGRSI